ncbi:MAG: sigma-70 family RNA polymerase sigma factor [Clostridia bacterium]|nr:sigma-70 family RNA polymerase sigma factor [Clostridia bacterium]
MNPKREEELIALSRRGDVDAFGQLVATYERHVYTVAFRFMGNHADASDLAQEAFLRAFRGIGKFRGDCSFKTWLNQITANVCRDQLRKQRRNPTISLDAATNSEDDPAQVILPDYSNCPEQVFQQREEREYLQEVLNTLPIEFRIVLILRDVQGLSYEEIANSLNIPLGTVKSRLNRARHLVRDKLLQEETQKLIKAST